MKQMASSLMLGLIVLFGLANQSFSQKYDVFDQETEQCLSMTTSAVCGMPGVITDEQRRQARAAADVISMIDGPIVEGSDEAMALGISVENPIVDLTFAQENIYRRCQSTNLLSPDPGNSTNGQGQAPQRRKRQAMQPSACCPPSPNTVRVVASISDDDRPVQLIQTNNLGQRFQDTTNCPSSTCTGEITCGGIGTMLPTEVMFLGPGALTFGRTNVLVMICGAVPV